MYTIFFTINCVEQLTFFTTFIDHFIFEQLIFFRLKVKLLESSLFPKINWIRVVDKKNNFCSNGVEQMKNCVEQIFWANKFRADDHDPNLKTILQFYNFLSFLSVRKFKENSCFLNKWSFSFRELAFNELDQWCPT
jgi:hypothetical protein